MGLRYLDRAGRVIDVVHWNKLLRNPSYAIVERTRRGEREIITSWLGVAAGSERKPEIFVVQLCVRETEGFGKDKKETITERAEHWFADEESALAMHRKLEKEKCAKN